MARTTMTAQAVSSGAPIPNLGTVPVDAVNGNQWVYTGTRRLLVNNGGATAVTVTIKTAATINGLITADRTLIVPAGKLGYLVESAEARQPVTGLVFVDWSAGASVTAALIEA